MTTRINAKNQTIFFIENKEVKKDTLFNFVIESADETTTPRGVGMRLFVEETENEAGVTLFEVMTWGATGSSLRSTGFIYDNEIDAEEYIWQRTYRMFEIDGTRDTLYFNSEVAATEALIERLAEEWRVDLEVAASILKKQASLKAL
jgi:hypothetical protein